MKRARNTPGPWRADERTLDVVDTDGTLIAQANDQALSIAPEEAAANARLIAAAPELLVVAEAVRLTDLRSATQCAELLAMVERALHIAKGGPS